MVSDLEARLQSLGEHFKNHASTLPNMGDVEPVDFVVNMIGDALRTSRLLDASPNAPITLNGIDLTLNVAAVHDAGGHLKFSVFGLAGNLGASRRTDDTHAIKISFQPQDLAGSTTSNGEPDTPRPSAPGQGNELLQSFQELKAIIDAERQQARPSKATITLNFVVPGRLQHNACRGRPSRDKHDALYLPPVRSAEHEFSLKSLVRSSLNRSSAPRTYTVSTDARCKTASDTSRQ
jgi:hypothetical protein